jgi:hypothetical protein
MRTTNGILYGTSKKDDIDISAFDVEGFGSDSVQNTIFQKFKIRYPKMSEQEQRQSADDLNARACNQQCAVILSLCDKIIIFGKVEDNYNVIKIFFANYPALQTN